MFFFSSFLSDPGVLVMGVLAVNVLILAVFIVASSSFFKRLILSQEEKTKIREEAEREAKFIRGRAQNEARQAVEDAYRKAEEILREMRVLGEDERRMVNQNLSHFLEREEGRIKGAGDSLVEVYQQTGVEIRGAWQKTAEGASHTLLQHARESLGQFEKTIEEEGKRLRKSADEHLLELRKGIEKEFSAARGEIAAYKKEMAQKVEDSALEVLLFVAKEVLGKGLSREDHETLIRHALEEAKKEGIFTSSHK